MRRVNERLHRFTCHPTRLRLCMNGMSLYSSAAEHLRTWLILISRPAEGRRLMTNLRDIIACYYTTTTTSNNNNNNLRII